MRSGLHLVVLTSAFLAGAAVWAQDVPDLGAPLTADQFDALTVGKTITYFQSGEPYGTEEYRPGHKVVWAFTESECREGDWFARNDQICFDYHDGSDLQCWRFFDTGKGLLAQFDGDDEAAPLTALGESSTPLNCPGPDVGA